jgi:hypothetical protein
MSKLNLLDICKKIEFTKYKSKNKEQLIKMILDEKNN